MICSNPTWITYAIDSLLFTGGLLCIVVMQKAEHDQQINRIDAIWLRNSRRLAFIAIALFAWSAAITDVAPIPLLLLFISTAVLLIIDAIAFNQRPPKTGYSYSTNQFYQHDLRQLHKSDRQR